LEVDGPGSGIVVILVLVGVAVGWWQLGMMGSVDWVGDRVDVVVYRK